MAEIGQVIEIKKNEVKVKLNRVEACAKCGACTAGLDSKDMFVEASNRANAKVGDYVEIQLKEENFLKAVAIMYGIPLIGLIVGLLLGSGIGGLFIPKMADILGILLGLTGAGVCFLAIHFNEDKFKTDQFKPKAVKVVENKEPTC